MFVLLVSTFLLKKFKGFRGNKNFNYYIILLYRFNK